ncbi:Alkaline ceramidase 3 [Trichoderma ghanense]|uniref:Alkaline ceramidase 3 n=1 Tax=Trichoderma ghanense TaxID=65468 RepID=A0ABY2HC30_9HYPO
MTLSAFRTAISYPYPTADPGNGFWGEQTSTLNFCEETLISSCRNAKNFKDYALTSYCAELCNTVTNAIFMWLGIRGVVNCLQQKHPSIFLISYLGYMVVGLGSILFHTTLKSVYDIHYLLDDACQLCILTFTNVLSSLGNWPAFACRFDHDDYFRIDWLREAQIYYHVTKDPVFHQVAYAFLTATVVFRSMWVMESQLRPVLSARDPQQAAKVLNTMWAMIATGLSVFLGGFLIWNLDNVFCSQVRQLRHAVGLPWAVLFEGHAWWHLMTGLAYYYITWGTWLRHCLSGQGSNYILVWPRVLTSVPYLQRVENGQDQDKKDQ